MHRRVLPLLAVLLPAMPARAVPLFARQTGQACAACHNGFPELTPYGRLFKLSGYTFGGGLSHLPPVSVMAIASFTHTARAVPDGAQPAHFDRNDNPALDVVSLFYGGVLAPHVGAFGQLTYDNIGKSLGWDNTDLRVTGTVALAGHSALIGLSVNNNPTAQDVWNSTPAWSYPYQGSGVAPAPTAATLIEGGLAGQVVGVTAYAYVDRLLYLEGGGYRTLGNRELYILGANAAPAAVVNGVAPYWRVAIEPQWRAFSWELGTFGLRAALVPGGQAGSGTDHLTDIGVDSQFQWLAEPHAISAQASWIEEDADYAASFAQGITETRHGRLRSLKLKTTYWYRQRYGATLAWFDLNGSRDAGLYGPAAVSGSANFSPNSSGLIGELDFIPFNEGGPAFWPWLNLKLALQYTAYTRFNGGNSGYDGSGRAASDNNTLYLFAWLAF